MSASRRRLVGALLASTSLLAGVLVLDGASIANYLSLGRAGRVGLVALGATLVVATSLRALRDRAEFGDRSSDVLLAAGVVLFGILLSCSDLARTTSYLESGILRVLRKVAILLLEILAGAVVAKELFAFRGAGARIARAAAGFSIGLLVICGILAVAETWVSPRLPNDWYSVETLEGKPAFLHRNDPEIRWMPKPNFRGVLVHPEFSGVEIRTNSLGFRDHEFSPGASSRLAIVLGDSFAFGMGVPQDEVFARRLEALGVAERVWNTGVSGFCNLDELAVFDRMLRLGTPSLVVVLVYVGNDLEENLQFLEREGGDARRRFLATLFPEAPHFAEELAQAAARGADDREADPVRISSVGRLRFQLEQRSKALRLLFEALDRRMVRLGWRAPRPVVNPFQIDTFAPDPTPRVRMAIDVTFEALRAIRDHARSVGARTLVCIAPGKIQVSRQSFLDAVRRAGFDPARCDLDRPQSVLVERLRAVGVETLDLIPALRASDARGERDYYEEGHWNAGGHALAAREVERYLKERP